MTETTIGGNSLQLYNVPQAAKLLSVTTRTLYTYIKDGKLRARKIGNRWKVTAGNLRKFIEGED